jgi:hypothetical protein
LPNLNAQVVWYFPCGTVGNDVSYGGSNPSHTHTTQTPTVTADSVTTPSHTHSAGVGTSYYNVGLHNHGCPAPGNSVNTASSAANRSNGSGQGANLAIVGHTHSWGSSAAVNSLYDYHSHTATIGTTCGASNHDHTATLTTTNASSSYIPDNVISMRYYIKW